MNKPLYIIKQDSLDWFIDKFSNFEGKRLPIIRINYISCINQPNLGRSGIYRICYDFLEDVIKLNSTEHIYECNGSLGVDEFFSKLIPLEKVYLKRAMVVRGLSPLAKYRVVSSKDETYTLNVLRYFKDERILYKFGYNYFCKKRWVSYSDGICEYAFGVER